MSSLSIEFFTKQRYASAVLTVMSVCLSVISRYCIKMATHRIVQTTPHDSPCAAIYKISTGMPALHVPSATAGLVRKYKDCRHPAYVRALSWASQPSHRGISMFPRNFHVSAEFHRILRKHENSVAMAKFHGLA